MGIIEVKSGQCKTCNGNRFIDVGEPEFFETDEGLTGIKQDMKICPDCNTQELRNRLLNLINEATLVTKKP